MKELLAQPSFGHGEVIVYAVHLARSKSPINVVCLDRVRHAFNVDDCLIEIHTVGEDVVAFRQV